MIRSIAKRMYTPIKNANTVVYPAYNEFKPDDSDDGYRILVDVCHHTKTVYIDIHHHYHLV